MNNLIITLSILTLISCNDTKKQTPVTSTEATHEIINKDASNLYNNSWTQEIELDNGAKWQANTETNEGVISMVDNLASLPTNTLDEYHLLAKQLNEDLNYVIKNCTMKGASHDNLHLWLLPLMEKTKALSEVKDIEDASLLKFSIMQNITKYNTYFQ